MSVDTRSSIAPTVRATQAPNENPAAQNLDARVARRHEIQRRPVVRHLTGAVVERAIARAHAAEVEAEHRRRRCGRSPWRSGRRPCCASCRRRSAADARARRPRGAARRDRRRGGPRPAAAVATGPMWQSHAGSSISASSRPAGPGMSKAMGTVSGTGPESSKCPEFGTCPRTRRKRDLSPDSVDSGSAPERQARRRTLPRRPPGHTLPTRSAARSSPASTGCPARCPTATCTTRTATAPATMDASTSCACSRGRAARPRRARTASRRASRRRR